MSSTRKKALATAGSDCVIACCNILNERKHTKTEFHAPMTTFTLSTHLVNNHRNYCAKACTHTMICPSDLSLRKRRKTRNARTMRRTFCKRREKGRRMISGFFEPAMAMYKVFVASLALGHACLCVPACYTPAAVKTALTRPGFSSAKVATRETMTTKVSK